MSAPRFRLPRELEPIVLPRAIRFGGHATILRQLTPADVGRLLVFFASHTPETVHARYGYFFTRMSPTRAAELVGVDQTRDAALGVFEDSPQGERLIAVGRYFLNPDGRSAETAFVVHEDRRGLGIATTLLHVLQAIAGERGVERLIAQVQHDNAPMLAIFRRAGAEVKTDVGSGAMLVTLVLQARRTRPPRRSGRRRRPM